ncbi:uncharacterized protein BO72DRAFT_200019 [Aspergillus fijiensis CBS 313.89]|uniref:Uncharacterized protein n=1 Tax=Aspergillus fijiensis CBS 313.89 TaxID=1448319 RepID=A0A8G1VWU4_9EURO|nr:uncharacterized protein BO72DRAFT_200019 [Aspergillus fijiensis CBS 313.89]RAK74551.1 hypothetical protein BO72DRAFT_200019 [Aspergillus fijiensis CBS 313.89]
MRRFDRKASKECSNCYRWEQACLGGTMLSSMTPRRDIGQMISEFSGPKVEPVGGVKPYIVRWNGTDLSEMFDFSDQKSSYTSSQADPSSESMGSSLPYSRHRWISLPIWSQNQRLFGPSSYSTYHLCLRKSAVYVMKIASNSGYYEGRRQYAALSYSSKRERTPRDQLHQIMNSCLTRSYQSSYSHLVVKLVDLFGSSIIVSLDPINSLSSVEASAFSSGR